jgi:hypothetical protein
LAATFLLRDGKCYYYYYYYCFYFIEPAKGFLPGGRGTTIRHNTETQASHKNRTTLKQKAAFKERTNNKGYFKHNEYKIKIIKLSLRQAVEAYGIV